MMPDAVPAAAAPQRARTTRLGHRAPAVRQDGLVSALCVVVMGVSGTGKTTVGHLLAARAGVPFADADSFHSAASIAKMSSGAPLDDADREPWLAAVGRWLQQRSEQTGGVIACSALARRYRDILRAAAPTVFFVHLTADRDELIERMDGRDHYMPATLVDSQLRTLEPLEPGERGIALRTDRAPEQLAEVAASAARNAGTAETDPR